MKHVTVKTIAEILGEKSVSQSQVSGYQIDSRKIGAGNLFFALKGNRVDGHRFLESVAAQGGVAAVVCKEYQGPDFGLELIFVEDVVSALQGLARHFMQDCKACVIGITGSLGKTTTKEFIATLLSGKYKVAKTHLNYNTKLTYPITLLNRDGDEDALVVELGMSEPGDIGRLLKIRSPDIAVVTKIAYVHGANFERGVEEISENKAEIFTDERTKKCIFDHELYDYEKAIEKIHSEKISFSLLNRNADLFLSNECHVDEKGVRAYQFDPLPYTQSHLLHNFLAAVAVARVMKVEWDEINTRAKECELPKMRFETIEKEGVTFINDAYNANPDSMKAALENMPEPKEGGKRIAVLGMMVDMGQAHEKVHREVGSFAQKCIDHLLVLGNDAKGMYEAFSEVKKPGELVESFEELSQKLKTLMRPGDVVLVKASRCVEMENLFKLL